METVEQHAKARGFKAAIFDMDGVVVDTVPMHFEAWKKMFAEYGKAFTMEDYKAKVDGIPRLDGGRAVLPDLSVEELTRATDRKQEYFLDLLGHREIPVFPSTIALIRTLREKNIKCAVISSSRNAASILEKVGVTPLLDAVVSERDITKGKPDPQIFLTAADKLGARPRDCIVFEDATLGVEAAKRAAMACVAVDRHGDPDRLRQADVVVSDLAEVNHALLTRLLRERD